MRAMLNRVAASLAVLAALAVGACKGPFGGPSREDVLADLRKEAESFKAKGEQPLLGVKSVWNIDAVDVQEHSGDRNRPWKGTVRFKIITTMQDADGQMTNDQLQKQFDYLYDVKEKRWLIQYSATPARPAGPARPARPGQPARR